MALYGLLTDDQNFQIGAYQWYAKSLRNQRSRLDEPSSLFKQGLPSPQTSHAAIEEILVPPVMMCYFELITGGRRWQPDGTLSSKDAGTGWAMHLEAGARMIQLIGGPEVWYSKTHSSVIAGQLYRTIRLGILHTSLGKQKAHFFSEEKWTKEPPDGSDKTPLDYLMDILLRLPKCLETWQILSYTSPSDELHVQLEADIWELLGRTDDWRQRHGELIHSLDEPTEVQNYGLILRSQGHEADLSKHSLTAMLLAGYVALYGLLWQLAPANVSPHDLHREQACEYGRTIMRLAKEALAIEATPNWAFPLKIISALSPEGAQREEAIVLLSDIERATRLEMLKTIF